MLRPGSTLRSTALASSVGQRRRGVRELWVCVDSTDANGVRLDEVDDGWYVTLSNGQAVIPALSPISGAT